MLHASLRLSPSFPQISLTEGKKKKSIQDPEFDYYNYAVEREVDLFEDELSHILEIYDFPVEFKVEDLMRAFQPYQCVPVMESISMTACQV